MQDSQQQQQQGTSAAEHGDSAGTAEESAAPAPDECCPLSPDEVKVAAALLVVLRKALKIGRDKHVFTKKILESNCPITCHFLQRMPDEGELPSLKQLEGSASRALKDSLGKLSRQCVCADCQPLEVFTRSAACNTHLRALASVAGGDFAARQQRLLSIEASLGLSGSAMSQTRQPELVQTLIASVALLAQHGIKFVYRVLIRVILLETIILLETTTWQLGVAALPPDHYLSCTAFIDHMFPGEQARVMRGIVITPRSVCLMHRVCLRW